jgi:hypothetical protein
MQRFIIIAAVLQIAMVVTGHYNDFVLMNLSAVLGVGIPLVVAFFYGRDAEGVKDGAVGGLAIGFVGAFPIAMGDQMLMLLAFGPLSSAVTGAIGGAVGFKLG